MGGVADAEEMGGMALVLKYEAETCSILGGMLPGGSKLEEIMYDLKSTKKECDA